MTEQAKAARRAYHNEWQRKNPDKAAAAAARYWEKKAAQIAQEGRETDVLQQNREVVRDDA